jgi:hypothetical protein
LSYSDSKIALNFVGLEELILLDATKFRTDIYLKDVDINDAGLHTREQILMVLKNNMDSAKFMNRKLHVRNAEVYNRSVAFYA